jgi:CRP-like cAMP-binding protein
VFSTRASVHEGDFLMNDQPRQPTDNRILDALPREDFDRLAPHLKPIDLPHGHYLYEIGARMRHVYFPSSGMISLVSQSSSGASVEVGVVGREGMVGVSTILGVDEAPHMTMAQIPGSALRLETAVVKTEFKSGGALNALLLRYLHAMLLQISQVAACNRMHQVEPRLARWLLMSSDRTGREDLPLTQEFLAMMLGTRRAGVTEVAIELQKDGLISYTRGHITIKDREGLEDTACECYRLIESEFARLASTQSQ